MCFNRFFLFCFIMLADSLKADLKQSELTQAYVEPKITSEVVQTQKPAENPKNVAQLLDLQKTLALTPSLIATHSEAIELIKLIQSMNDHSKCKKTDAGAVAIALIHGIADVSEWLIVGYVILEVVKMRSIPPA